MNLVGKIFTVLIFLMCVVFGTFALMVHAAHKNWKEVVVAKDVGLNDQLIKANKEKQDLTDEKKILETALNDEKARMRSRLTALENEKNLAVADRDDKERKLQVEEGKGRVLVLAIQEVHKRLGVLQTAIDGMRNEIKVVVDERNATQTKLVTTTDQLLNAVNERQRLEKLQRELAAQIVKLKEVLNISKAALNGYPKNPPFELKGQVTAVLRPDVVEISVGADDGVCKGHKFQVTRPSNGKFVGIIEVIQVDDPNRAVCRPDKAMQSDQIQKGDHVEAYIKPR